MVLFSIFETILCIVSFFLICPEQHDGTTDAPTDAPTVLSCPDGEIKATLTYPGDQCEEGDTFKYALAGPEDGNNNRNIYLEIVNEAPADTNVDTFCMQDFPSVPSAFLVTPCADSDANAITLLPAVGGLGSQMLCRDLPDCDEADYKYRQVFFTSFSVP